jgi:WD40-like Beta Propeller Repeat
MITRWTRAATWVFVMALALAVAAGAACGGGRPGASSSTHGTGSGSGGEGGTNLVGTMPVLESLSIHPATATITSVNGSQPTQSFQVQGKFNDGTTQTLSNGVTWSTDSPPVGAVDGTGLYTASGSLGGVVHVSAAFEGQTATATLTVKLLLQQNPAMASMAVQTALQGATAPDTSVVFAYPYDGTVWPRGLLPPILQWNGGAATDAYYVHVVSSSFELQQFATATNAPSSQLPVDPTVWSQLTGSIAGKATVTVARWNGTAASVLATQTWTIAPASMRGTIYYWSNNLGRVLRIQPGAAAPDDFSNKTPLDDPAQYTQTSCLMTCHTVSADGSTIVSGGGVFGGSYGLQTDQPTYSLGGTWPTPNGSSVVRWMMPALSPDGKYVLTNSMAEGIAYANDGMTQGFLGMYTTADGKPVPTSGLMNLPLAQPTWSPDGSRVVFVDAGDPVTSATPWYSTWNDPPPGDLKAYRMDVTKSPMASGLQTLVSWGTDPTMRICWPSITPDGKWVMYGRAAGADTRSGNGDLYFASAVTPNEEVRLAKLDGDGYPFAAGSRDLSWNYEPSFAPVAAGGYFWVVFTSRRTYGNILTGPAEDTATPASAVKQLWVAAIDLNPKPGVDPSHAPFHLEGQDETNLAMRGFWSLPPCEADGQTCSTGTDCCGGYCSGGADGGAPVCGSMPQGCSQDGNKCSANSDCCDASSGVTCINHVCSEAPPQ